MSRFDRKQNSVKQLSFNKKIKNIEKKEKLVFQNKSCNNKKFFVAELSNDFIC